MYLTLWRCNVDYNIVLIKSEIRFEHKHRKGTQSKYQLSYRKEFTVTLASGLDSHCGHLNDKRDGLFSPLIELLMWLFWCGPDERSILWHSAIVTFLFCCLNRLLPWRFVFSWGEAGGTITDPWTMSSRCLGSLSVKVTLKKNLLLTGNKWFWKKPFAIVYWTLAVSSNWDTV